ncbi:MAG: pyruvate ferredoxin oxidoreductase, partial [Deltaproteobacteria bacterium]|nr:pyruvate ferredoxin oxidoreductase [Deltaproteobacteria bacterium]
RTYTATSSQGVTYMHENLFVAAGSRLPIVMSIVNRFVGAPQALGPDQGDSLDQRDTGWIQIYAENAQEVHDLLIQAFRIAEDKQVLTPVAICHEGIIISHKMQPVQLADQDEVNAFLPPYRPEHAVLDPSRPMTHGIFAMDATYPTEYRYQQQTAMDNAKTVIDEVDGEYGQRFGRRYGGLIATEMMEGAEVALVAMGTLCTAARTVVKKLRKEKNCPVGLVKVRAFRPFPDEALRNCLSGVKAIAVLDRNVSVGSSGIVYGELSRCLNARIRPLIVDYILGLGGREVTEQDIENIAMQVFDERDNEGVSNPIRWYQLREA